MALRAVPDHPKFASLKSALGQPKGAVIGWLEIVWHFTGRFTPRGDIGKYSDQAIESWAEWNGKPGALIAALVKTGWIDPDADHRLLIHDWSQHADKATKNALLRSKQTFYCQSVRTPYVQCTDMQPESGTVYGLPEPVPEPVPVPEAKTPTPKLAVKFSLALPSYISQETWEAFDEMRKKIRAPMTNHAKELILQKLGVMRDHGEDPEAVLNQSISRAWRGIFPVEHNGKGTNGKANRSDQMRRDAEDLYGRPGEEENITGAH